MNAEVMIEFFKMKCREVILDCDRAIYSDDVDEMEFAVSELDGMWKVLQIGDDDDRLDVVARSCYYAASAAFMRAHNRINYDPDTGEPRRKTR